MQPKRKVALCTTPSLAPRQPKQRSLSLAGAGLVFTEAAAVLPEGRISPEDLGLWGDQHVEPLARVARFVKSQGAVAGAVPVEEAPISVMLAPSVMLR